MREEWKDLNLVDLMNLLEPVPEPAPISMTPQTVGWIWLGCFLLILSGACARYFWRRWNRNAYRRRALNELEQERHENGATLAELVRRTALAAYPRSTVASLHGRQWLEFLDRSYGGNGFTTGPGKILALAPYREGAEADDLKTLVRKWIKTHRGDLP